MNKVISHISVVIVVAVVAITCWQSYTVVHFYAHQDEIETAYCENIDRPELECHGQCHLKKQLGTKSLKVDSKSTTVQSSLLVFQSFELLPTSLLFKIESNNTCTIAFVEGLKEGVSNSLLDPPELVS